METQGNAEQLITISSDTDMKECKRKKDKNWAAAGFSAAQKIGECDLYVCVSVN